MTNIHLSTRLEKILNGVDSYYNKSAVAKELVTLAHQVDTVAASDTFADVTSYKPRKKHGS